MDHSVRYVWVHKFFWGVPILLHLERHIYAFEHQLDWVSPSTFLLKSIAPRKEDENMLTHGSTSYSSCSASVCRRGDCLTKATFTIQTHLGACYLSFGMCVLLVPVQLASYSHSRRSWSLFMLSLADPNKYWQVILAQGVGMGIGQGFLLVPAYAIQSHWWQRRRSMAMGVVSTGTDST